jgi:hypothetical protein
VEQWSPENPQNVAVLKIIERKCTGTPALRALLSFRAPRNKLRRVSQGRRTIQLPQTSGVGRRRDAYLKLLSRINSTPRSGFAFEGCFFKCGARVEFAELRPSTDYPEIPVLLEHSRGAAVGIPGNRRAPSLYVLWRWKPEIQQFSEMGRATSFSWEWTYDLAPLAMRVLAEARGAAPPECEADLPAIAIEISAFLDKRLAILKPADRERLLGILHDHFAARFCA